MYLEDELLELANRWDRRAKEELAKEGSLAYQKTSRELRMLLWHYYGDQ